MLILASASSARRRLLDQAGIPFEVMISGFDEAEINHSDPIELVQRLAYAKAALVAKKIELRSSGEFLSGEIGGILGCDSVFQFQNQIFGKPVNKEEAIERLMRMSSNKGVLHTGHVLLIPNRQGDDPFSIENLTIKRKTISTSVYFGNLSREEIHNYVATGEPLNCAGGFAIDGIGGIFISRLDGCYSNVIGLSLPWLRTALLEY